LNPRISEKIWGWVSAGPFKIGSRNAITRVQWLEKTLGNIPPGLRLLDAGCGRQQFRRCCSHLKYVGQDFAKYDGKGDGSGLQMGGWNNQPVALDLVCDITSIPEPDASFDAIMCTEVLEHVPDPVKVLQEFQRLLRPGGWLILTAPFCSLSHFAPFHFSTGFNRYWYDLHLAQLGFTIAEIDPNGDYYEFLAQELRRLPWVARKYCPRPVAALALLAHFVLTVPLLGVLTISAKYQPKNQGGSSDLLCFGYHVAARRS
jgi:ubiquinone/menaquinone biosynthesis C-methylase UbiE